MSPATVLLCSLQSWTDETYVANNLVFICVPQSSNKQQKKHGLSWCFVQALNITFASMHVRAVIQHRKADSHLPGPAV